MKSKHLYKCEFCEKEDSHHEDMSAHEKECYMNPQLEGCYTCIFSKMENFPHPGADGNTSVFYRACLRNLPLKPFSEDLNKYCKQYVSIQESMDSELLGSTLKGYSFKRQFERAFKDFARIQNSKQLP